MTIFILWSVEHCIPEVRHNIIYDGLMQIRYNVRSGGVSPGVAIEPSISAVEWRQCIAPGLNPDARSCRDPLSDGSIIYKICDLLRETKTMTRMLRTALTAVLLLGLLAGGAGAAAADTVVVNDDDVIDTDCSFNNITANVLGVQNDDSPVTVIFSDDNSATSQMY